MATLQVACQCLLVVVFGAAVCGKLRSKAAFVEFTAALRRMLPRALSLNSAVVRGSAAAVLVAEVAAAALILPPATTGAGLLLAGLLLAAFATAIAAALRRGDRGACACFGRSGRPLHAAHVVRNILLLAVVGVAALGPAPAPAGIADPAALAVGAAAGLVAALPVLLLDDLIDLFTSATPRSTTPHELRSPLRGGTPGRTVHPQPAVDGGRHSPPA